MMRVGYLSCQSYFLLWVKFHVYQKSQKGIACSFSISQCRSSSRLLGCPESLLSEDAPISLALCFGSHYYWQQCGDTIDEILILPSDKHKGQGAYCYFTAVLDGMISVPHVHLLSKVYQVFSGTPNNNVDLWLFEISFRVVDKLQNLQGKPVSKEITEPEELVLSYFDWRMDIYYHIFSLSYRTK